MSNIFDQNFGPQVKKTRTYSNRAVSGSLLRASKCMNCSKSLYNFTLDTIQEKCTVEYKQHVTAFYYNTNMQIIV